jgi:hypothetical protein
MRVNLLQPAALIMAVLVAINATAAERTASNCPKGAPPVEEIIKEAELDGMTLVTHQRPEDGMLIRSEALPRDEWFALQRAHLSRRVAFGLPSGRNDFYLYRARDGALIMIFAARGCHVGTLRRRNGGWRI